jgi:hypothetical protein
MGNLHENLQAFLCMEVTGLGIPNLPCSHMGKSPWWSHHPARHPTHTKFIDPDNYDTAITIYKNQRSNPSECVRIVLLCTNFLTWFLELC